MSPTLPNGPRTTVPPLPLSIHELFEGPVPGAGRTTAAWGLADREVVARGGDVAGLELDRPGGCAGSEDGVLAAGRVEDRGLGLPHGGRVVVGARHGRSPVAPAAVLTFTSVTCDGPAKKKSPVEGR